MGYGYVTNRMGTDLQGDPRDVALRAAIPMGDIPECSRTTAFPLSEPPGSDLAGLRSAPYGCFEPCKQRRRHVCARDDLDAR